MNDFFDINGNGRKKSKKATEWQIRKEIKRINRKNKNNRNFETWLSEDELKIKQKKGEEATYDINQEGSFLLKTKNM